MNPIPNPGTKRSQSEPPRPARSWVWAIATLLVLAGLGGVLWKFRSPPASVAANAVSAPPAVGAFDRPQSRGEADGAAQELPPATPVPPPVPDPAEPPPAVLATPAPIPAMPVDPAMSGLVAGLVNLRGTNALTPELIQAWKGNLEKLVQSGAAAVPAISAFLAGNQDSVFDTETTRALGFRTARLAALDALRQIGGPEAIALMDQTLGETKSPRELAALAWNLDGLTEGQYREKALTAARAALARSATETASDVDVAPLFEVFQKYGGAANVPELEQATGRWKYYAVATLANLPEGAGVASLVRMADPTLNEGNRLAALQMLAQLAVQSPEARQSLLSQVGGNQIAPNFWAYLNAPLAGDEFFPVDAVLTKYPNVGSWSDIKSTRINYGNQSFYTLPGDAVQTVDGINQRLAVLDQFLAVATEPAGQQSLQQAKDALARRLSGLAANPAPVPSR